MSKLQNAQIAKRQISQYEKLPRRYLLINIPLLKRHPLFKLPHYKVSKPKEVSLIVSSDCEIVPKLKTKSLRRLKHRRNNLS